MKDVPKELFAQLLKDAALPEREASDRVAKALDPSYWRTLCGVPSEPLESGGPTSRSVLLADAVETFRRDGTYRLVGAIAPQTIARLNRAIDAVLAAGWPGVFAFACDDLWAAARLPAIKELVEGAIGPGARQIPHVWTHLVRPGGGNAGWPPHIDGPGEKRMTVWLALTDAGLDNGCMYAVPRDEAVSRSVLEWSDRDLLEKNNVKALLQGTRAMPASAGDLLGWAFDIVHWGGPVAGHAPGRRSISLEFIAPDAACEPADEPLVPLIGALPPHNERLRAIAAALLEYKKFEPLARRYAEVARRLAPAIDPHG